MIPLSIPNLAGNEWKYIKSCLDTNWVSSAGEYVNKFENDICQFTGAKFAVSCVNGTAALHLALLLAGVKQDDEVLVPTLTFIAPVNTVKYVGANPVFMDCDDYFNIDANKVLNFLDKETYQKNGRCYNKSTDKIISAIIPVHIFGNAVNLESLIDKCHDLNIKIIEDATESLGSFYNSGQLKKKHTGTVGDIGCYSFNGNKIITTGGGGMFVTNDDEIADKAKYLTTQAKDDEIHYIHHQIGYNYRLTNIQAAMGVAQLEQLNGFIQTKRENYNYYKQMINKISGLELVQVPQYASSNYWFYAIQIDTSIFPLNRNDLMNYLSEHSIQTRPIWQLSHLQKPYKNCQTYKIENAPKKLENVLNFPCSSSLTRDDINLIYEKLQLLQ